VALIQKCRAEPHPESQLIAVLHKIQSQCGYLAETHLDAVAQLLQVPAAKVAGVASFYHFFRLKPRGKFLINVCLGTACYVKGPTASRSGSSTSWASRGAKPARTVSSRSKAPAASAPAAWPPS